MITLCEGGVCPLKTTCKRYELYATRDANSECFEHLPLNVTSDGEYECEMYFGWREMEAYIGLIRILNENKNQQEN